MRLTSRNEQVNKTKSYPINPSVESLVAHYSKELPFLAMHYSIWCRNLGQANIPYLKTDRVKSEKSLIPEVLSTTLTDVCISVAALLSSMQSYHFLGSLTWLQEHPEPLAP
jgi:hypothetical protein